MKIKNPYQEIPYQVLSLSTEASRKEVDARYGVLAKQGRPTPEMSRAWTDLKSSSKRLAWDIFCVSLEQEQQSLQELVNRRPTFPPLPSTGLNPILGREFLVLNEAPPPLPGTDRAMTLILPTLDDPAQTFRSWLSRVNFDV